MIKNISELDYETLMSSYSVEDREELESIIEVFSRNVEKEIESDSLTIRENWNIALKEIFDKGYSLAATIEAINVLSVSWLYFEKVYDQMTVMEKAVFIDSVLTKIKQVEESRKS